VSAEPLALEPEQQLEDLVAQSNLVPALSHGTVPP
jgi:hypothetical protein